MIKNPLLKGLQPIHPGEMLRDDILPALGRSRAEIAKLLGISRHAFYAVLNEKKPITADLALRIDKLVGGGAETWLRMQQSYDLEIAERALAKMLKSIPTLHAAE